VGVLVAWRGDVRRNQGLLHARMLVARQQESRRATSPPFELALAPAWAPALLCFSSLATFPLIRKAATTARSRVRAKRAMVRLCQITSEAVLRSRSKVQTAHKKYCDGLAFIALGDEVSTTVV
jgi:hypothetical protein